MLRYVCLIFDSDLLVNCDVVLVVSHDACGSGKFTQEKPFVS